jgi:hypothetical protein
MSESLASFRDLKGIGPATEARLHEAGVYTWEALGAAASALAAVRGNGDSLREVASLVAAQRTEAGGQAARRACPLRREALGAADRPSPRAIAPWRQDLAAVRAPAASSVTAAALQEPPRRPRCR